MSTLDRGTYRIREFAALAGVTVRALHHYERLGLLKPKRTSAGYRTYSTRDLEELEQIVALKFIGVPLKQIPILRLSSATDLANALRAQRETLNHKRRLLDHAIGAIEAVEGVLRTGKTADAALFRRIIEVIEMQNNTDEWKKTYDTLLQTKIERLRALSPEAVTELRTQWAALVADVQEALSEDAASPKAQELATRWVSLLERLMGGPVPTNMVGVPPTSQDLEKWPQAARVLPDTRVWDFIRRALSVRR